MITRKGDIVITVTQDNRGRSLKIDSVEEKEGTLRKVLGYEADEIAGRALPEFLPPRINEILGDYLEFTEGGKDLGEVLQKTRNFAMIAKSGKTVDMDMRIQQAMSSMEAPRFMLVMQDRQHGGDACRHAMISFKEKASREHVTLLLDEKAFFQASAILGNYLDEGTVRATLAVVRIDHFEDATISHGFETANGLLREMVLRCREVFRESDIQAYLGRGKFAIVLLDADQATSRVPLNRLRLRIANQPLFVPGNKDVVATLSIVSCQVQPGKSMADTLIACDKVLAQRRGEGNQIIEV